MSNAYILLLGIAFKYGFALSGELKVFMDNFPLLYQLDTTFSVRTVSTLFLHRVSWYCDCFEVDTAMPCFKNISFKRLKVPASYLTLGGGCGRIFPEKSQKAVKETSGAFNAPESRRQVKAGAETADRIPPEPLAQLRFSVKKAV